MAAPRLAVIIVSWNVRDLLDACLTSLRKALDSTQADATTWVFDNASTDGSSALVKAQHPWAHLVSNPENIGYVRANNTLLRRLDGVDLDFVWLLNPDTVVPPGSVQTLLETFTRLPKAGILGPKLLNPDGTLQESGFRFPGLLQPLFDLDLMPQRLYYSRLNGRYPRSLYQQQEAFPIDHPLGAAMMVRCSALRDVGLLDEGFFMYCEEIDWAWRLRKAGWQAWLVPAATVVHYGGASTQQAKAASTAYLWESRARLYRKHAGALTYRLVGAVVRHVFSRRRAPTHDWQDAHARIIAAWKQTQNGRTRN